VLVTNPFYLSGTRTHNLIGDFSPSGDLKPNPLARVPQLCRLSPSRDWLPHLSYHL